MKLARYMTNWNDAGEIRYAAGRHYPLTEETQAHVVQGVAELVEVDIDPKRAEDLAAKAQAAAEKAALSAAKSRADADAAHAVAELAREAEAAIAAAAPDEKPVPPEVSYPDLQLPKKK